jgi:hypothetical protein
MHPGNNQSPTPTSFNQDQSRNQDPTPKRKDNTSSHNSTMPANQEEDPFCMYKEEHIREGVSHCKNSIIGKILSNKLS